MFYDEKYYDLLIVPNLNYSKGSLSEIYIQKILLRTWGRGYLVYLSDGDLPFFMVSFSPILLGRDIKRAISLEPLVTTFQKGKFC